MRPHHRYQRRIGESSKGHLLQRNVDGFVWADLHAQGLAGRRTYCIFPDLFAQAFISLLLAISGLKKPSQAHALHEAETAHHAFGAGTHVGHVRVSDEAMLIIKVVLRGRILDPVGHNELAHLYRRKQIGILLRSFTG